MRLPLVIIGVSVSMAWGIAGRGAPPWPARQDGEAGWGMSESLGLRGLQCVQHGLCVAGDLYRAPFGGKMLLRRDQERAAHHAQDLAAVHVLLVDHVERLAEGFIGVADQREVEPLLRAEVVV